MTGFGDIAPNNNKKKNTTNGPELLKAAVKAHKIGDTITAEKLYLKAINSGFQHEIALSNLGVIYKETGRSEKAIEAYKRAISKNPNFADAYTNLGNIYKDLGEIDQALALTLKSLELKPENPEACMNIGTMYQELGNLDKALTYTIKCLDLNPDSPEALMNLGGIYKEGGNLDKARFMTTKSLELKPEEPSGYINLASIYRDLGELDKALSAAKKYIFLKASKSKPAKNLDKLMENEDFIHSTFEAPKYSRGKSTFTTYFKIITSMCDFEKIKRIDWHYLFSNNSRINSPTVPLMHLLPYSPGESECKKLCSLAQSIHEYSKSIKQTKKHQISECTETQDSPKQHNLSFGFLSNDIIGHSASPFLYALVNELVKQGHTVNIYTNEKIDRTLHSSAQKTALLACSNAVSLQQLNLDKIRNLIAGARHDVIIDTEGCTNEHRNMKILNGHLAPFQVTWLGYPGTTGNKNIDFILTDKYYCPTIDNITVEKPLAINGCSVARYPLEDTPACETPPFINNKYITFGTLNNSYKVTPLAISIWSKILLKCKDSRFIFCRDCYASASIQSNLNHEFESHGISRERISYINNKKYPNPTLNAIN